MLKTSLQPIQATTTITVNGYYKKVETLGEKYLDMFGLKPLIKEKYDYLASHISKDANATTTTTKIIGQQDIIEFVDNALASPLTINVLFNGSPRTGKTSHLQRLREKLPNAFYHDFGNTSGAGFIYSYEKHGKTVGRK
jgi:predicted ATPase with chaperone activity